MSTQTTYLVRLKPYNKKRGFLVRNYTWRGHRFTDRWSEVSSAVARELEQLIQPHDQEAELPLFDIYTRDEAAEVEEKERDKAMPGEKVARTKDADVVPDSDFRDDKPKLNPETGKIERNVEPAEVIEPADEDPEPEPAPSLRSGKKATKKRTRKRD